MTLALHFFVNSQLCSFILFIRNKGCGIGLKTIYVLYFCTSNLRIMTSPSQTLLQIKISFLWILTPWELPANWSKGIFYHLFNQSERLQEKKSHLKVCDVPSHIIVGLPPRSRVCTGLRWVWSYQPEKANLKRTREKNM